MRGRRVTKIVDRRQAAVRAAAAGYRASPGESTPSCGASPAAVPEVLSQGPVTACRRPVAWFSSKHGVRFGTVAPAPPYGRGSPDSHLSGSCHRWDGRGSRRWGRRDAGGRVEGAGHIELPPRSRPTPVLRFIASVPAQTTA